MVARKVDQVQNYFYIVARKQGTSALGREKEDLFANCDHEKLKDKNCD